jgi:hypothetical protein
MTEHDRISQALGTPNTGSHDDRIAARALAP